MYRPQSHRQIAFRPSGAFRPFQFEALDQHGRDQAHFQHRKVLADADPWARETRRITGFSPEALRHGFLHEEAFWIYRAWAQLAGYAVPTQLPWSD